ncbi:MAG: hypothetical protein WKF78_00355 [Candidatus Limnocylindrales bacterium]
MRTSAYRPGSIRTGRLRAMKAWQVTANGEPGRTCCGWPTTTRSGAGRRTRCWSASAAAALNFPDILLCRGTYQERPPLPFTPGIELTGEVVYARAGADLQPG